MIKLTKDEFKKMCEQYPTRELGKRIGVSGASVSYWARKLGIKLHKSKKLLISDDGCKNEMVIIDDVDKE